MRKIAVVTGTRAEYGLLRNTIRKINEDNELELQLIATGTHLSQKYGMTKNEIENDGFHIDEEIPILQDLNDKEAIAKSMGMLMIYLSHAFQKMKPDMLLILGDRYEIFSAASVAMAMNIPIAHISGGEITEGAIDEQIRHAITKMAHIHFPGSKIYADNIRKMGEESWRIFNVGDPAIENIKNNKYMTKEELKNELGVNLDNETLLITFHPTTLEVDMLCDQVKNLIEALSEVNKNMVITYPNSDNGGDYIINELLKFKKSNDNVHLFKNLGTMRYLSVMKQCSAVVGNSSSAIIEAPYLHIPVVNVGNRQKGRIMSSNIIQCSYDKDDIARSIRKALSDEFILTARNCISLYGEGNTSEEIVKVLKSIEINDKLLKKKLIWS